MTGRERLFAAVSLKEPDYVPLALFPVMHGAKELGIDIKTYLTDANNLVEGQLRLQKKYSLDAVTGFNYAAAEYEAWGGDVLFRNDCPPNSTQPVIKKWNDIASLEAPRIEESKSLQTTLEATKLLKEKIGSECLVVGVAISPFSLPVMQLGFEGYLDLIYSGDPIFERLMSINKDFCVNWANAQLQAGADAIVYFDPVSSTTILPRDKFLEKSFELTRRTLKQFHGGAVIHFASGRCIPILNDIINTGAIAVGVSVSENLQEIKRLCRGHLAVLGNLNGIEMTSWTPEQAAQITKTAIAQGGPGGGFALSDSHGEIPWQVSEDVLYAITQTVRQWGQYPLDWVDNNAG